MKFIKQFASLAAFNSFTLDSNNTPNVSLIKDNYGLQYTKYITPPHDYSQDYFTFEAIDDIDVLLYYKNSLYTDNPVGTMYYSVNEGSTWSEMDSVVSISAGNKIMFKGVATECNGSSYTFDLSDGDGGIIQGRFNVEGNIMSVIYGDDFKGQTSFPEGDWSYIFSIFFYDQSNLINASNLILPVTTLDFHCYSYMFNGCTSLTTAPELPATTLLDNCYQGMFNGCTLLNYVKCLATNISANQSTEDWVTNVASSGTFVKNSSMSSWPEGDNGIPSGWDVQNA